MIQEYREPIIINIDDMYGFQRKAEYIHLIDNYYTQTTVIRVRIRWYKEDIEINDISRNITSYEKEIIADNFTLVNINTGVPVMTVTEFNNMYQIETENGITWKEDTPTNYMKESDYYCYIRDNVPILIKQLIVNAIIRANERGSL